MNFRAAFHHGLLAAAAALPVHALAGEAIIVTAPAIVELRSCSKPEWPKEALRKEQTGTVTLAFLIGSDGKVKDAKVLKSVEARNGEQKRLIFSV